MDQILRCAKHIKNKHFLYSNMLPKTNKYRQKINENTEEMKKKLFIFIISQYVQKRPNINSNKDLEVLAN